MASKKGLKVSDRRSSTGFVSATTPQKRKMNPDDPEEFRMQYTVTCARDSINRVRFKIDAVSPQDIVRVVNEIEQLFYQLRSQAVAAGAAPPNWADVTVH